MKGDLSRRTFDPRKHYAGVLMQQGRVQLDADWNEQEAIQRRRARIGTRDVVGACGGPIDDAGFTIGLTDATLTIGAGRYYVDGILVENEVADLDHAAQPDLPAPEDWVAALEKAGASHALVYLDVWDRHITALDDPRLREVALGGPDTATRVKTVWQVRVLPLAWQGGDAAQVAQLQVELDGVRKEIARLQEQGGDPAIIEELQAKAAEIQAAIVRLAPGEPVCASAFPEWDALVADPTGMLNARTRPAPPVSGPCVVPPTAGYRRLENQLYRVEIHEPGALGTATFTWSRDNGSVVTTIERISGKDVIVHDLGPDDVLGFATGQWVEISDDASELAGLPGQLAQVAAIDTSLRRITLAAAPGPLDAGADGVDPARHPKLRRWDQGGTTATADGVLTGASWQALEDGVEVEFSDGTYATGDHWLIPARTATGEIEWPPYAIPDTSPEPQPRAGIDHHRCRLALLAFDAASGSWSVADDCREIFPPLTASCCEAGSLHVVATNWRNDDRFAAPDFTANGLRIALDGPPDPASLTGDSVEVALEAPLDQGGQPSTVLVQRLLLRGVVSRDDADPTIIVWRPRPTTPAPAPHPVAGPVGRRRGQRGARPAAEAPHTVAGTFGAAFSEVDFTQLRVRVTLKGRLIWNDPALAPGRRVHLDGIAMGRPAVRADDGSPRTELALPSGLGGAASDFESWFFFGRAPAAGPLQVTAVRFLDPHDGSSSAGDITFPRAGAAVRFKAGEEIASVQLVLSRAVEPDSVRAGDAASVFIESVGQGVAQRLAADVKQESDTVVRYVLRDPPTFRPGRYVLTCLGSGDPAGGPGGLLAMDDRTALDGDLDGQAGGDLRLPFVAI